MSNQPQPAPVKKTAAKKPRQPRQSRTPVLVPDPPKARLLKVELVATFVVEDEGELVEIKGQPLEVAGRGWKAFAPTLQQQPTYDQVVLAYLQQGQPAQ